MFAKQTVIPPLEAGNFLLRAEFERRYHAHPEIKKAELIEGIVYIPPNFGEALYGKLRFDLIGWLGMYAAGVVGLSGSAQATLCLDNFNEPQPDALLRFEPEYGGGSTMTDDGYLEGPVEFVLEVAGSSASYDMNQKKQVYARHGISEYLILLTHERRIVWYVLRDGNYEEIAVDEEGILRSEILPGLWLKQDAVWQNDMAAILATLQHGLASPEHKTFVEKLTATHD